MAEYSEYYLKISELLKQAETKNDLTPAAEKIADVICGGGIIYLFGCGHSHLIALDCFYRAGGLACVQPVLKPELMLHLSASNSSRLEKSEESVKGILSDYKIGKNDALIVISTSGINGAPVQVASDGQKTGAFVIGLGSSCYFGDKSRHSSGKILKDCCDFFIDNFAPHGDALISLGNGGEKSGPCSTVISSFLVQKLLVCAEQICVERGKYPPVFKSGNVEGGKEFNKKLEDEFCGKIKSL